MLLTITTASSCTNVTTNHTLSPMLSARDNYLQCHWGIGFNDAEMKNCCCYVPVFCNWLAGCCTDRARFPFPEIELFSLKSYLFIFYWFVVFIYKQTQNKPLFILLFFPTLKKGGTNGLLTSHRRASFFFLPPFLLSIGKCVCRNKHKHWPQLKKNTETTNYMDRCT